MKRLFIALALALLANLGGGNLWAQTYGIAVPNGNFNVNTSQSTNNKAVSSYDYWTLETTSDSWKVNGSAQTNMSGRFAEMWNANGITATAKMYQNMTLPAGTYTVSAYANASPGAYIFIGDQEAAFPEGSGISQSATITLDKTTTVDFGVRIAGYNGKWFAVDNFTMTANALNASLATPLNIAIQNDNCGELTGWDLNPSGSFAVHSTGLTHMNVNAIESWVDNQQNKTQPDKKMSQTLTDMPAGKYVLQAACNAVWQSATADDVTGVNLFLGDATTAVNTHGEGKVLTVTKILTTSSNLTFGVDIASTNANWVMFDNFVLTYYGNGIELYATPLPANGEMEADKWYEVEIPLSGEYNLTATTLGDIVYTSDGAQNISGSVSASATSASLELEAGKYYFKSSSANTLGIVAAVKNYELGAATTSLANGAYIGAISTFTVTYADAVTNDDDAVLGILDASKKATLNMNGRPVDGVLSASGNTLTATFTGVTLQQSQTYTLTIPAGAFGYSVNGEAKVSNEAVSVTLNTGALANGTYYYYNEESKGFLSRGAAWGTEAVVDKYGIAATATILPTGKYTFTFVDNNANLYRTDGTGVESGVYTDNSKDNTWDVNAATGGYVIADGDFALNLLTGTYGYYLRSVNNGTPAVWTLKTQAERDAIINAYPAANIAAVKTAAGITTSDDFAAYLDANYNAVDMSSKIAKFNNDNYTKTRDAGALNESENWNGSGSWAQTVTGLPEGIYKITVQAFNRNASHDSDVACAAYNVGVAYMSANGEQVRLKTWNEIHVASGNSDGWYPNSVNAGKECFAAGNGVNEVYVYVGADGNLELKLAKPSWIYDCWLLKGDWTLTRYEQASATMTITSAEYATFIAPFDVEVPEDVAASTVTGSKGGSLALTPVENNIIPANTPVVLYKEGVTETFTQSFYGKAVEATNGLKEGLLVGTYTNISAPKGSYVLQNHDGKVGFYLVGETQPAVKAGRAYLTVPAETEVREFFLFEGDMETGIAAAKGAEAGNEVIYDLTGRRVSSARKGGIYIVNGKKVMK